MDEKLFCHLLPVLRRKSWQAKNAQSGSRTLVSLSYISMCEGNLTPPKQGAGDLAHALGRAALSAIPFAGGAAVELFNAVLAPPIIRRRDEWMEAVAERLQWLTERGILNFHELKDNPVFIDSMLQATQAAMRSHQEIKRDALRNAVLNSALSGSPDSSTQVMFIGFVDRFTEWHIRILDLFSDPMKWAKKNSITYPTGPTSGLRQILLCAFPQLEGKEPFYQQVWRDLYNLGLIKTQSMDGIMSEYGALQERGTAFGNQFLRFISEPQSLVQPE